MEQEEQKKEQEQEQELLAWRATATRPVRRQVPPSWKMSSLLEYLHHQRNEYGTPQHAVCRRCSSICTPQGMLLRHTG